MRRRLSLALAALLVGAGIGGCGEPDVGGLGRLHPVEGDGAGDHLVLEGTPYQMGWWHGHLLKDRIRALHEEWQRQAFALDGDLMSEATQARRKAALALVEPVLQNHLPEAIRQEYQGLSDACGLPVRTLLLTEMLTDVLRFMEERPRLLTGDVVRGAGSEGVALTVGGPWERLLASRWLRIKRKASDGSATTVLTWPGGLGGVLVARSRDFVVALAAERELERGREGLAGVPFRISLRLSAEGSADPVALLARLSRTTGHHVLAVELPSGPGVRQLLASTPDEPSPAAPAESPYTGSGLGPPSEPWKRVSDAATSFRVNIEQGEAGPKWSIGGGSRK